MDTTTINGLHSCKPGNDPVIGQVKLMVVQHMTSKKGKPYLKIKNANAENGGTPHRILSAEPTGFTDANGNISFNIEVEASSSPPSTVQNLRATMQQGEPRMPQSDGEQDWPEAHANALQSTPPRFEIEDGVTEARKHLCQSANLYNLCVKCVNHMIAENLPEVARTSEMFQAATGTLFIEASRAGYVQKMPEKPL